MLYIMQQVMFFMFHPSVSFTFPFNRYFKFGVGATSAEHSGKSNTCNYISPSGNLQKKPKNPNKCSCFKSEKNNKLKRKVGGNC